MGGVGIFCGIDPTKNLSVSVSSASSTVLVYSMTVVRMHVTHLESVLIASAHMSSLQVGQL